MQTEKQRERLVELLRKSGASFERALPEEIADYLMSNNVVVLPCKVDGSQKVYYPVAKTNVIYETRVWALGVDEDGYMVINPIEYNKKAISMIGVEFGKTVFLSREKAENVLKERNNGT